MGNSSCKCNDHDQEPEKQFQFQDQSHQFSRFAKQSKHSDHDLMQQDNLVADILSNKPQSTNNQKPSNSVAEDLHLFDQKDPNQVITATNKNYSKFMSLRQTNDQKMPQKQQESTLILEESTRRVQCFKLEDGSIYEGYYEDNLPHGRGRIRFINGDLYEGEFNMGVFEGKGQLIQKSGQKYRGRWLNGKREGQGEEMWPDGKQYKGHYEADQLNGYGELRFNDRSSYIGQFKKGNYHGFGIFTWEFEEGTECYEGDWVNGIKQGEGSFQYKNGNKYEGGFVQDKRQGTGMFQWKNGQRYQGEFLEGNQHGKGTLFYEDGRRRWVLYDKGTFIKFID